MHGQDLIGMFLVISPVIAGLLALSLAVGTRLGRRLRPHVVPVYYRVSGRKVWGRGLPPGSGRPIVMSTGQS